MKRKAKLKIYNRQYKDHCGPACIAILLKIKGKIKDTQRSILVEQRKIFKEIKKLRIIKKDYGEGRTDIDDLYNYMKKKRYGVRKLQKLSKSIFVKELKNNYIILSITRPSGERHFKLIIDYKDEEFDVEDPMNKRHVDQNYRSLGKKYPYPKCFFSIWFW